MEVVVAWRRMDAVVRDIGGALVPLVVRGSFIFSLRAPSQLFRRLLVVLIDELNGGYGEVGCGTRSEDAMGRGCHCVWVCVCVCIYIQLLGVAGKRGIRVCDRQKRSVHTNTRSFPVPPKEKKSLKRRHPTENRAAV